MAGNINYPMPKEMVEMIEKKRADMMINLHVRRFPKTKFVKRYVKLSFLIPNEIKKIDR